MVINSKSRAVFLRAVDTSDNPRRAAPTNRNLFDLIWALKRRHGVGAAVFLEQPRGANYCLAVYFRVDYPLTYDALFILLTF